MNEGECTVPAEIALVVAVAENRVIGRDNRLIWRIPEDLKFFRRVTMGCPVIMGRKTYESIGKPLPGRQNIVMTRDSSFQAEGVSAAHSVEAALAAAGDAARVFVIGGADLFALFLPMAGAMYMTCIGHTWDGDTYFPEWREEEWQAVWEEQGPMNLANPYMYWFREYRRI